MLNTPGARTGSLHYSLQVGERLNTPLGRQGGVGDRETQLWSTAEAREKGSGCQEDTGTARDIVKFWLRALMKHF